MINCSFSKKRKREIENLELIIEIKIDKNDLIHDCASLILAKNAILLLRLLKVGRNFVLACVYDCLKNLATFSTKNQVPQLIVQIDRVVIILNT